MKKLLFAFFIILVPNFIHAATHIDCDFNSAPSSEAQGGVYTCSTGTLTLFYGGNQNGPVFDHITSGGWNDSGAAKFYSHTSGDDTYRYLIPSSYTSTTQQNIRFLIKFEDITELGGKWFDTSKESPWRSWLSFVPRSCSMPEYSPEIAYNGTTWIAHTGGATTEGCCTSEGYRCCAFSATWTAALTGCTEVTATRLDLNSYENQWVAMEVERQSNGIYKVYVWTQDGVWNGLYYWIDTTFSENLTNPLAIGVYLEGAMTGKYFIIDEVKVSDAYIGPPDGFTGPYVSSVSSDKADGSYKAGEVIDIDVTFSENVTSDGNVTVTLETGDTDRTCTFTVTDASTGTCNYTVQAGDTSADLTVSSIAGTVADGDTNAMTTPTTPATNLAANKAIVIDTTVPTLSGLSPSGTIAYTATKVLTLTTSESATCRYHATESAWASMDAMSTTGSTSHNQTVNVSASTAYTFNVLCQDTATNESAAGQWSFTTLANEPPVNIGSGGSLAIGSGGSINFVLSP